MILGQLAQGGALGQWKVGCWAFGADDWTARQVVAALHGAVPEQQRRRLMAFDSARGVGPNEPVSVLTTPEAAGLLRGPLASVSGLLIRPAPPAARRPDRSADRIVLGRYWSADMEAAIGTTDLEGHAFVTGTTGSGKTTTLHRLLAGAWNERGIPFLVIDPVKDEYSAVASCFRGGIAVLTGNDIRMNLMTPLPGDDPQRHVMAVAQAFRGAFTMPSPTPYVVTQLFDQVAMTPGGPEGVELYDVRDWVDRLVASLGYAAEANSNIRASLLTRFNLLLGATRAHRFVWPDSSMIDEVFRKPTVITLADIVDDEERSFVVLLLALATWSRARARRNSRPVEHLLVLEEAHRVLPDVSAQDSSGDVEAGSAKVASAQMLTSMLAEVRSYGQQVIVVDQSPAKVAADVVRNTNLKIIHRTVSDQDQRTVCAAVGMAEEQRGLFGSLARGQAVISTRQEPLPQTVQIEPAGRRPGPPILLKVPRTDPDWPCCQGAVPQRHFAAWRHAAAAERSMALYVVASRVGEEDGGDDVQSTARADLLAQERALGVLQDCLAWTGLRRILMAERAVGVLPRASAVNSVLGALFKMWRAEVPVCPSASATFFVPRTGVNTPCPDCARKCYVRGPAWIYAQYGPRTGLPALATANWRADLGGVADWAGTEHGHLKHLLGIAGADTVIRCQVRQAVNRARLTADVGDHLLKRNGIAP